MVVIDYQELPRLPSKYLLLITWKCLNVGKVFFLFWLLTTMPVFQSLNVSFSSSSPAPSLSVSLSPALVRLPNQPPHNDAVFTCVATVPTTLEVDKAFSWISNFGNAVNNTGPTASPRGLNSSNNFSVTLSSPGVFSVTCSVSISIPGDPPVSASNTSAVTVTGKHVASVPVIVACSSI